MTQQFKVGDKVKTDHGYSGTVAKDRGDSIFDVAIPGRIGPSSATPGAFTYQAKNLTRVEEPAFKVGDRVRMAHMWPFKTGVVQGLREDGYAIVLPDGDFKFSRGCATEEYPVGSGTITVEDLTLIEPEPKFKVGDRVRREGSREVETVTGVRPNHFDYQRADDPFLITTDKDDRFFFERRFEPATQEFKLKPGDRVKNLKTGRIGIISGDLKVHALVSHDVAVGNYACDAAALEAWEAEHPGTYDLVFEEKGPF